MRKTIKFDVMCEDRFVRTMEMEVSPIFPVTVDEMRNFFLKKMPTFKNKQLEFYICEEEEDGEAK